MLLRACFVAVTAALILPLHSTLSVPHLPPLRLSARGRVCGQWQTGNSCKSLWDPRRPASSWCWWALETSWLCPHSQKRDGPLQQKLCAEEVDRRGTKHTLLNFYDQTMSLEMGENLEKVLCRVLQRLAEDNQVIEVVKVIIEFPHLGQPPPRAAWTSTAECRLSVYENCWRNAIVLWQEWLQGRPPPLEVATIRLAAIVTAPGPLA